MHAIEMVFWLQTPKSAQSARQPTAISLRQLIVAADSSSTPASASSPSSSVSAASFSTSSSSSLASSSTSAAAEIGSPFSAPLAESSSGSQVRVLLSMKRFISQNQIIVEYAWIVLGL
jgi:hypothetical protein